MNKKEIVIEDEVFIEALAKLDFPVGGLKAEQLDDSFMELLKSEDFSKNMDEYLKSIKE